MDALRSALRVRKPGLLLAGHGVAERFVDRQVEEVHIDRDAFIATIDMLQTLGFDFIDTDQLIMLSRSGWRHSRPWVHLGFDDGYHNNLTVVLPILAARNIPFAVYASTYHIETGDRFPTFWLRFAEHVGVDLHDVFPGRDIGAGGNVEAFQRVLRFGSLHDQLAAVSRIKDILSPEQMAQLDTFENDRPMTVDELQELGRHPLVHIGSHSHHHVVLHADQDPSTVRAELTTSRQRLADDWQITATPTFCYPNGDTALPWQDMAAAIGYPLGFGSDSGFVEPGADPQLLPRFFLSTPRRALVASLLALVGNRIMPALGRPRPQRAIRSAGVARVAA